MGKFIKKWALPLRWWLFFAIISLSIAIFFLTSGASIVFAADFTKISFLILALFYVFSIRQGVITYKISKELTLTGDITTKYDYKNEVGWFVADILLTLGMIGTVSGFIYMLSTSFAGLSTLSIAGIQSALLKMSIGMSTALYTTAAGLICSLLLKLELFDFDQYLKKQGKIGDEIT